MLNIFDQVTWLLPLGLLCLGLMVGSFLNVVIYRLPLMMETRWRKDCCELLELPPEAEAARLNLATPNSHCPHCGTGIKPWHNIPVLSYLFLRGKCAACGTGISLRYPTVELVTGLLTLALVFTFPASPALLGAMIFTWALVALTMIDVDHKLLPDDITLPLLWLGLLLNLGGTYTSLADAVAGAMLGYLALWSVYWLFKLVTGKEGMGYGDFKLLAALGAWMGWQALPMIILLSSVVGAVCGIALILFKGRGREQTLPFGPYLAAAGWIALMWGETLTSRYLSATGLN
ncbi:MAG: prepilin peptidase [Pseudomonadales bacterium]|nr:prepilin peptidase [Pseudomonadales bacterium]